MRLKGSSLNQAFLLFIYVLAPHWQGELGGQQLPRIEVDVRPSIVRLHETFRVTVRVASDSWPDAVDLEAGGSAEILDYVDRTSTRIGIAFPTERVLERVFELRAVQAGILDGITVTIAFPGQVLKDAVPAVTVAAAPLDWGRAEPSGPVSTRSADRVDPDGPRRRNVADRGRRTGVEPVPESNARVAEPPGGPPVPYGASPYGAPPYGPSPYGGAHYGPSPYGAAPGPSPNGASPYWPSPYGAAPSPYGAAPYGPSPYGAAPGPSPYGGSPYAPSPYGASPYAPSPYGAPYGAPPYGPSPYGAPYGNPPYGPSPYGASPYGASPYGFGQSPNRYGARGSFGWGTYDGSTGGLSNEGGWAETAAADPEWPQLMPRWDEYRSRVSGVPGVALLEVGLTPERAYVGQQVTLLASASFAPGIGNSAGSGFEFHAAEPSNGWIVALPPVFTPPVFDTQGDLGGEAHVFLEAVFPTDPGLLVVDPSFLVYSSNGSPRGSPARDTLTAEYLEIEVLAIPQPEAPPGWRGAVGRYQVSAWLDATEVNWGESALLTVEISGAGYLPTLVRPDTGPVWGGGIRPLGEASWVQVRDGVVGGSKRFTWVVSPGEPGSVRIGPVHFSFFDPFVGAFGQVTSDELILEVGARE